MGNLRAAALACGVVASCFAGGIGISYISSDKVSSAKIVAEDVAGDISPDDAIAKTVKTTSTPTTENAIKTISMTMNAASDSAAKMGANYKVAADQATVTTTTAVVTQPVETTATTVTESQPVVTQAVEPETEPAMQVPIEEVPVVDAAEIVPDETEYVEPAEVVDTIIPEEPVYVEPVTEAPTYVEPVTNAPDSAYSQYALPITDAEYVLLCNAVANEAGSVWISETDKAKIVEVIMNRVSSSVYPDTIYDVITQRHQFTGASSYANLDTFTGAVTESVKSAVLLYFADPSQFNDGYLYFYGNGSQNIFYK